MSEKKVEPMFTVRTYSGDHLIELHGVLVAKAETRWWAEHLCGILNDNWEQQS